MTDPNKDNVLLVHWHDLGRYLGVYGHRRRDQPPPRPTRRRGHPLHPRARHGAALLAVAGFAVHRPLPAEQRAGRAGPPRLGVPRGRPHPAADLVRERLAYSAFRDAARDFVSRRGSASTNTTCPTRTASTSSSGSRRVARRTPPSDAVPADRRLLRDPPARIRATAMSPPTRRTVARARLPARRPTRSARTWPTSTARSRWPMPPSASCSTRWPRPASTSPPGWSSSPTTARRCRGRSRRCTTRAPASR